MRVDRWTSYEEAASLPDNGIGGCGGWFGVDTTSPGTVRLLKSVLGIKEKHTWKDYADQFNERGLRYVDALRAEILARGLRRGGDWHQNSGEARLTAHTLAVLRFMFPDCNIYYSTDHSEDHYWLATDEFIRHAFMIARDKCQCDDVLDYKVCDRVGHT